ncbi:MAG: protease inhibitor I42 family protein [Actinomycetota bacterium]
MTGKWWIGTAVGAAALGVIALVGGLIVRQEGGVRTLDESHKGAVVELAVGEQIVVELDGNATTGYTWEVTAVDAAVLAPAGDVDYRSESDADGAGGAFTFRFDAVARGETTVTLVYHRSWEDAAPVDVFTFTAVVD